MVACALVGAQPLTQVPDAMKQILSLLATGATLAPGCNRRPSRRA